METLEAALEFAEKRSVNAHTAGETS